MRLIKPAAAALAVAIAATVFAPMAEARDHHFFYRHGGYHHDHGGFHRGDAFGAGIAGFAAGAILGSLAQPDYYYDEGYAPGYYYQEEPAYYYQPAPVYVAPRAYYNGHRHNACRSDGTSRPATSMC